MDGKAISQTHYQVSDIQPIEIMQKFLTPAEFQGFLKGNVIKYILRVGHKDKADKEIDKVIQYALWLQQAMNGETINPWEGIKK